MIHINTTTSQLLTRGPRTSGHAGREAEIAHLDVLASAIGGVAYEAHLIATPGRRPRLQVINRDGGFLTEDVYAEAGSYWWSWADRIAPVTDVAGAAQAIMTVLRTAG